MRPVSGSPVGDWGDRGSPTTQILVGPGVARTSEVMAVPHARGYPEDLAGRAPTRSGWPGGGGPPCSPARLSARRVNGARVPRELVEKARALPCSAAKSGSRSPRGSAWIAGGS